MLTRFGFTTVVDVASDLANTLELRRRIDTGEVSGPADSHGGPRGFADVRYTIRRGTILFEAAPAIR